MIAVLQRVKKAQVSVCGSVIGKIDKGLMVLLAVENGDTEEHMEKLCDKMINLRIFSDENGKMNLSVLDTLGSVLLVSQFTLIADCRKGRRPSFINSAQPDIAKDLYEKTAKYIWEKYGVKCETGEFGADMQVELINDGPVTIILNTKELM